MPVLKGKKKFIFFLIIFFSLTTYKLNVDNDFPIFKIKKIQFKNDINLEENIKFKLINYLNNRSLINLDYQKISSILIESQWVRNFKVNKNYPNKIIIEINELKPIALFKEKEKIYYINSNFDITDKTVTKHNNLKKILILGIYQKELLKKNFLNIVKFNIAKDIKSIKILNLNRLDIYFKNNIYVKLGDYDINLQMRTLTQIMKKYQNLNTIDLRNKGRAVIK
jgi:cell division septal protein FtsQ